MEILSLTAERLRSCRPVASFLLKSLAPNHIGSNKEAGYPDIILEVPAVDHSL
jgi:hypothetical protein